jgi:hypothetical protein
MQPRIARTMVESAKKKHNLILFIGNKSIKIKVLIFYALD